jgi:ABC-type phosphate/phosphonate transport system substrate-binding protein
VSSRASSLDEEAAAFAETLSSETDLTITVTITDDYGVALKAFCAGQAGLISTNAFGYLAAQESGCGEGIYAAEVDGATATQGQMLAGFGRDIFTVEGFEGYRFCRPGPDSVNGWVVPALKMRAVGINPLTDLFSVTDSGSDRAVVEQMVSFRCDIGASALGAEEGVSGNDGVFVVEELPQVPNDTVMISGHLSEITKAIITDSIRAHLPELVELVNADSLIEMDDSAFTGLRDLFTSAGISPSAMGN